jgi:predicted GIY-YIG superfamily endonuclease
MTTTPLADRPHALYRFYDRHGTLLYVGLTLDPSARWATHSKEKPWWLKVTDIRIEHFPDRESVEAAEKRAIRAENPRHNVTHSWKRAYSPSRHLTIVNCGIGRPGRPEFTINYRFTADRTRRPFDRKIVLDYDGDIASVRLERDDYMQDEWARQPTADVLAAARECQQAGIKRLRTGDAWGDREMPLLPNDLFIWLLVPDTMADLALRALLAAELNRSPYALNGLAALLAEGPVR